MSRSTAIARAKKLAKKNEQTYVVVRAEYDGYDVISYDTYCRYDFIYGPNDWVVAYDSAGDPEW